MHKNEEVRVLLEGAHIRWRWQYYFHILLNEEGYKSIVLGELKYSERYLDFRYCRRISVGEVEWAMRRMNNGKATGPDDIPMKFWKSEGKAGLKRLSRLFNIIFRSNKMHEE